MHEIEVPVLLLAGAGAYGLVSTVGQRARSMDVGLRAQAAFLVGIGVLAVALIGPLDEHAHRTFAGHMVQHLLIISVAAPLLAAGRAWDVGRALLRRRPEHEPTLAGLVASGCVQVAVLMAWHISTVYTLANENDAVHALEHTTLLTTAFWLWTMLLRSAGAQRGAALIVLFVIGLPPMAYGVGLVLAPASWYPTYSLGDQQMAGVMMWAYGGVAATVGAVLLFAGWLVQAQVEP